MITAKPATANKYFASLEPTIETTKNVGWKKEDDKSLHGNLKVLDTHNL